MAKGTVYISRFPDDPPEWYWTSGLHDACIKLVEAFEFPFDYDKFSRDKGKYDRNLLVLTIDAEGALYDTSVTKIHLHNYKILTPEIAFETRKDLWWLSDRLSREGDCYVLEIDLQDLEAFPHDFTVKIKFDRAEVDRK